MLRPRCSNHGRELCSDCIIADDVAKRCWEQVKNVAHSHDWETRIGSFLAIRLSDGSCDGTLYESKQAAVRHVPDERWYAFFSFRGAPNGFASPKDAAIFLAFHRAAYDRGFRLPDPDAKDGGPDLIMPMNEEHVMDQLARLLKSAVQ